MFTKFQRFPQLVLLLSAIACLPGMPAQGNGQTPQPNPAIQTESMLFTVLDHDRHSVNNLKAEDVRVFEGDKERQVVSLQRLDEQPLTLAILIDKSRSQEATLPGQKLAADAFVKRIMRQDKDQVTIISFTGQATIEQDLTKDLALVLRGIARVKFEPPLGYVGGGVVIDPTILGQPKNSNIILGSTALWDAIWATSEELPTFVGTSKAIILLSDGEDTSSKTKMSEAIERAIKADIAVYSIGIGDERTAGVNTNDLRKLSDRTGGRAFFPKKVKDLDAVFAEIEAQLHSQYQITYRSEGTSRKTSQKVRLEITNSSLRGKELHVSYQQLSLPRDK